MHIVCVLSHVWLFATSWTDCSLPDSSVHRIFQARILEWVAISSSRGPCQPRDRSAYPELAGISFPLSHQGNPYFDSLQFKYFWNPCLPVYSPQFSYSVMSDSLQPHGLQHPRLPFPSPAPKVCSNSCPLSQWCHPTISSSAIPSSSCLQSFPASGSSQMSQFFPSGG